VSQYTRRIFSAHRTAYRFLAHSEPSSELRTSSLR
jgi:hypothetical protein